MKLVKVFVIKWYFVNLLVIFFERLGKGFVFLGGNVGGRVVRVVGVFF